MLLREGYLLGIEAVYRAFPWDHYRPEPQPSWPDVCVFCHDRRADCGRRIVRVRCKLIGIGGTGGTSWQADFDLEADAWTPATPFQPESTGGAGRRSGVAWQCLPRGRFRVLAGQADASDPSRFTIAADVAGRRHTVDGRLNDDGTVALTDPQVVPDDP